MPRKPKFKPEITRVKLNPEQAVLVCDCSTTGGKWAAGHHWTRPGGYLACTVGGGQKVEALNVCGGSKYPESERTDNGGVTASSTSS